MYKNKTSKNIKSNLHDCLMTTEGDLRYTCPYIYELMSDNVLIREGRIVNWRKLRTICISNNSTLRIFSIRDCSLFKFCILVYIDK